jgi:hypothetical protein
MGEKLFERGVMSAVYFGYSFGTTRAPAPEAQAVSNKVDEPRREERQ